jgi:hypothetical protein
VRHIDQAALPRLAYQPVQNGKALGEGGVHGDAGLVDIPLFETSFGYMEPL